MIDQWMEWDTDGYSTLSSQTNTYNTNYNTNYCENVVADIPIEVLVCTSIVFPDCFPIPETSANW